MPKVPLFVTGFSLSAKTAIGTQTRHFLAPFPEAEHAYWRRFTFEPDPPRSTRLEHSLVSRYAALQRAGRFSRLARLSGLAWWDGDRLRPSVEKRLISRLAERASHLYVAPIDRSDAARTRHLVERLRLPYVLHLWDSLDDPIQDDPNFVWLIQNAGKVMVLTESLREEAQALGVDAEILLFTRPPAAQRATTPPTEGRIRIGLLGDILSYFEGMQLLDGAVSALREEGIEADLTYIGPERVAQRLNARIENKVACTGFLSDAERDAKLASCHFGFLPGPGEPPEKNLRSRYSIPSRTLDLLSVGLPIVGPIHPRSATAQFLRSLGVDEGFGYTDPGSLAARLRELSAPEAWRTSAAGSSAAFECFQAEDPIGKLKDAMEGIARQMPGDHHRL